MEAQIDELSGNAQRHLQRGHIVNAKRHAEALQQRKDLFCQPAGVAELHRVRKPLGQESQEAFEPSEIKRETRWQLEQDRT